MHIYYWLALLLIAVVVALILNIKAKSGKDVPEFWEYRWWLYASLNQEFPKIYQKFNRLPRDFFTEENVEIRFLVVAFQLLDLRGDAREQKFQELLKTDTSRLMAAGKELIFELAENLHPILQRADAHLHQDKMALTAGRIEERNFGKELNGMTPEELFLHFFPDRIKHFQTLAAQ